MLAWSISSVDLSVLVLAAFSLLAWRHKGKKTAKGPGQHTNPGDEEPKEKGV